MTTPRLLVVEDDDAIRTLLVAALRREHFEVDAASDGHDALALTRGCEYAVILLDLMLPRMNGFEFLEALRSACPDSRSVVFVMTAFDDSVFAKLRSLGVHAIMRKPFDVAQVITMVREVALTWNAHASEEEGSPSVAHDELPADESLPS